jgi:hypothetical protein
MRASNNTATKRCPFELTETSQFRRIASHCADRLALTDDFADFPLRSNELLNIRRRL